VATLAAAFHHDPVWSWAFPDEAARPRQLGEVFELLIHSAIPLGWVWAREGYEAATVWIPPGCSELDEVGVAELDSLVHALDRTRPPRILEVISCFEAAHPRHREHFYLSLLGTHPASRGGGLGMALLAENLELVDREGMPAYLESTNPANVRRYESVGFEVLREVELPAGCPSFTSMWREPLASS
jgi:GNAT superfamily N-acetyltransferase